MLRVICCVVVGLCLLAAGCGDDEGSGSSDGTQPAGIEKRTGGWTGTEAVSYDVSRTACGESSPRETASDLGLPRTAAKSAVAEKYSQSFPSDQRQPAIEGCLAGLTGQ